jgi:hypothetical protein
MGKVRHGKTMIAVYVCSEVVRTARAVSQATGIPISRLAEDGLRLVCPTRLEAHTRQGRPDPTPKVAV